MLRVFRHRTFYLKILIDAVLIGLSLTLAYGLRFEFSLPLNQREMFFIFLPVALGAKIPVFFFLHVYRRIWRYIGIHDLLNLLKAVLLGSGMFLMSAAILTHLKTFSRGVFVLDMILTFLLLASARTASRLILRRELTKTPIHQPMRLMIIGAGSAAEKVVREVDEHSTRHIEVVGFLDDDPQKIGKTLHNIGILGRIEQLEEFQDSYDNILIAIPSATGEQMRRITAFCEKTGKPFRTLPSLAELIHGNVSLQVVRKVSMQDLLRRDEIVLEREHIAEYLSGKCVMITGAGGSIGSELVRQVCQFHPARVVLLDISEYNLFQIELRTKKEFRTIECVGVLVDIRNQSALRRIFQQYAPRVVFHTAAYKHVPMQELHPWEAVMNNVVGTKNLIELAKEFRVDRFVLVSTDKAVRPTNVMGTTKRIAEKLVTSICPAECQTRFMVVRFGNVLGSSGSVVPIFQQQIVAGGPITITHPEITRFFMTIPEAAQLILQAGSMGNGQEIFILDMGNPIKIVDLAHDLIRLYGYEPECDIKIEYTGLRPGEKLYEELITHGEGIVHTGHKKIMVLCGDTYDWNELEQKIEPLVAACHTYDASKIKQLLFEIVPEYTPQKTDPAISPHDSPRHIPLPTLQQP